MSTKKGLVLNPEPEKQKITILCLDITNFSQTKQFLISTFAVFVFFLLYGYMQELIFTIDGFQPYGWFLTCLQFALYTVFGFIETRIRNLKSRKIPIQTYFLLALLTLGTMGLSNASLGYLNYPTQVIFKCCKLIPVLIGGILIQQKRYGPLDFIAAVLMCVGLTLFTLGVYVLNNELMAFLLTDPDSLTNRCIYSRFNFLADSQVQPNFSTKGIIMISTALLCDAIIGNVQEKSMKNYGASNAEVVLYSYFLGFVFIFIVMILSGEFIDGVTYYAKNPRKTYGYTFLFSLTGYLGIQIVLTLVRTTGAFTAVTVTTCRKAVTIIISFIFFTKPFTSQYLWSGLLVIGGIYMNLYNKKHPLPLSEFETKVEQYIYKLKSSFKKRKAKDGEYMSV